MPSHQRRQFRFGDFVLDPGEQRLTRLGRLVHLRPKTFAVLVLLLDRHPHLVDRQTFFDTVWPGVHVTDDALSKCIKEIRHALGDDDRQPRFVRTVPKRGYTFVHRVEAGPSTDRRVAAGGSGLPPAGTGEPRTRPPGIAVLPFVDMSQDRDQQHFCDGMAEEILTALARLDGLRVVARTSAFAFKGRHVDVRTIGRTLDVDTVLEGSVRRADDRIRVTAQLVSTVDGSHLWAERYDRAAADVFALQDDIALAIARALEAELAGPLARPAATARAVELEAYQLFLKGRFFLNRRHPEDLERALAHFGQALVADPRYAPPAVAMADAFIVLGVWGFMPPRAAFSKARHAAERALRIDEALADAHLALAVTAFCHTRDRSASGAHFRSAFDLGLRHPMAHEWYASYLVDQGRDVEALAEANQGLVMDPLSPMVHIAAGAVHLSVGQPDRARALLETARGLDPVSPAAHHLLGWSLVAGGRDADALAVLRRSAEAGVAASLGLLGVLHARAGKPREAEGVLAEFDRLETARWVPSFERALVHAALGNEARSLELVDAALACGEPVMLLTLGRLLDGIVPAPWLAEVRRRSSVPLSSRGGSRAD